MTPVSITFPNGIRLDAEIGPQELRPLPDVPTVDRLDAPLQALYAAIELLADHLAGPRTPAEQALLEALQRTFDAADAVLLETGRRDLLS